MSIGIFIKSVVARACIYVLFMNYVHNQNKEKNIDLLKYEILVLIRNIKGRMNLFRFYVFKQNLSKIISFYEYTYSKYSSYLAYLKNVTKIADNNIFVEEFEAEINNCDDLFVLYLFYDFLKGAYSRYELEINNNK